MNRDLTDLLQGIMIEEDDVTEGIQIVRPRVEPEWESKWKMMVESIKNGTYKNEYSVGQVFPVEIEGFGIFGAKIIAMDTDKAAKSNQTTAFTFLLTEILTCKEMNGCENPKVAPEDMSMFIPGTGAINGWMDCELRKWLHEELFYKFPKSIRDNIVTVQKVSRTFTVRSQIVDLETADALWIPSKREIYGPGTFTELKGPVYDEIFTAHEDSCLIPDVNGIYWWWWLRSCNNSNYFFTAGGTDKKVGFQNVDFQRGIVVGFCFGLTPIDT